MNPFCRAFHAGRSHLGGMWSLRAGRPGRKAEGASLRSLPTGSSGRVVALTGGHGLIARLAALGLTPGAEFAVAQNSGYGPVIVLVRDTRLALGRGEAAHVLIAPAEAADGSQPA